MPRCPPPRWHAPAPPPPPPPRHNIAPGRERWPPAPRLWHLRVGRQPTTVRPKGVGLAAAHVVGVEVAPRVIAHQARPLKHAARDVRAAVLARLLAHLGPVGERKVRVTYLLPDSGLIVPCVSFPRFTCELASRASVHVASQLPVGSRGCRRPSPRPGSCSPPS